MLVGSEEAKRKAALVLVVLEDGEVASDRKEPNARPQVGDAQQLIPCEQHAELKRVEHGAVRVRLLVMAAGRVKEAAWREREHEGRVRDSA
eukprot:3032397-Prymnesium_polylepis.2